MDADDLARFLRAKLPAYMVPATFTRIERVPLTANGKVDRRALPAPAAAEALTEVALTAPRTPTEEILCSLCAQVLGLDRVGIDDSFFDLGGHSLLATRLLSRVRETLGVELPLGRLFEAPAMAALAQAVEEARRLGAGLEMPPIVPVPRDRPLPLSFPQQRLWFLKQLVPDSPLYNVHVGVRCTGRLDVPALARTVDDLALRHEVLRTLLPAVDGRPVQVILPPAPVPQTAVDLTGLPEGLREPEAQRLMQREVLVPFSFDDEPLLRVRLIRLSEREHILLMLTHHIVWDDWSQGVLVRDFAALYGAYSTGRAPRLPFPEVQYADFSVWQRSWLESEVKDRHLDYWRNRLDGVPLRLELPTDRPRPAEQTFRGRTQNLPIASGLEARMRELTARHGATFFMTAATAFEVLLHRYSRQDDIVVGTLIGNRNRPEIEGLLGFFVNTLPLRADLSGDPTAEGLLGRVRSMALEAYDHQDLPFERLVEALKLPRDLGYNPLTQVVFNQFNAEKGTIDLPGLTLNRVAAEPGWAPFDLNITVIAGEDGLLWEAQYARDLYDVSTMDRLLRHLHILAEGIVAEPARPISELPMLSASEREQLGAWNETGRAWPAERALHEWIEEQVDRSPDAVAVFFEGESLTYRQLDNLANGLARQLARVGVGPESRVGVAAERSLELVVALLGVLKAGAAYVPLDPSYPRERLSYLIGDARVQVLLTQERLAGGLPETTARTLLLDGLFGEAERPRVPVLPENLAYVIYTSGSTGQPKGAMNTHRGIVNRLLWMQGEYGLAADDRVLQKTPFSFDVSVWEFFWPLLAGARLVLARPGGHQDGEYLVDTIVRQGVTTLHFVPSMLRAFVEVPGAARCGGVLRRVIASGEALTGDLARRFAERLRTAERQAPLHNLYGPTEAAVDVTFWPCGAEDESGAVPIGRPVANTEIHILGRGLEPLPAGVPGELLIGGVQIARGYLERPDLTAERFVPHPARSGERLYRTGDLTRWRQDGAIEFLGRLDHQVKVRGFRIELGEIETVLEAHPAVREAAVLALASRSEGHLRLVAFAAAPEASGEELRAFLAERLPEYMVPTAWVFLEALPLSPNGKVDRKALAGMAPDREIAAAAGAGFVAPRTPVEETLAAIWRGVLGLERVGVEDNFFQLGGDSILSIQVIARAYEAGIRFTPNQLFHNQTIARLASLVEAQAGVSTGPVPEQGPVTGPVPLTPIQRWFLGLDLPERHHFNQSALLQPAERLDPRAMAAAVGRLVEHHDALRLRFERGEAGWAQVCRGIEAAGPVPFAHVDLAALPAERRSAALTSAASALQASLDLAAGPLLRVALFEMGAGEPQRLLAILHHLVVDGVSWRILLEDLQAAYRQLQRGDRPALPPKTTSFQRWAELLAERAGSAEARSELDFWLAGIEASEAALPLDFPDGADVQALAREVRVALAPEATRALLQELPAASGARDRRGPARRAGAHPDALDRRRAGAHRSRGARPRGAGRRGPHPHGGVVHDDVPGDARRRTRGSPRRGPAVGQGAAPRPSRPGARLRAAALSRAGRGRAAGAAAGGGALQLPRAARPDPPRRGAARAGPGAGRRGPRAARPPLPPPGDQRLGRRGTPARHLDLRRRDLPAGHDRGPGPRLPGRAGVGDRAGDVRRRRGLLAVGLPGGRRDPGRARPHPLAAERTEPRVKRANLEDIYGLSPLQQGMLFHFLEAGRQGIYFEQPVFWLDGPLDAAAFERAWQRVVDRHPVLRTAFVWEGVREPVQVVHRKVEVRVEARDWQDTGGEDELRERLARFLEEDQRRGFDLTQAPLARLHLIETGLRTGEQRHIFVWSYPHLLLDGWSLPLVLGEVFALYEAFRRSEDRHLPQPRPYRDYIALAPPARSQRGGGLVAADPGRPAGADPAGARRQGEPLRASWPSASVVLEPAAGAALQARARDLRVTLSTLAHGAWALLLGRYAGEDDVVFGSTVSGRPAELPGVEKMVGLFINTVPVRVRFSGAERAAAWLRRLQEEQNELRQHEHAPLIDVQRWSGAAPGQPLFETLLVFENYPVSTSAESGQGSGLRLRRREIEERTHLPLVLVVVPGSRLTLRVTYDRGRFDAESMDRLLGHLATLLAGFAAGEDRPLADLPLLTEAERRQLLASGPRLDPREPFLLHRRFEDRAARSPEAVALTFEDQGLTYRELNARADRLARRPARARRGTRGAGRALPRALDGAGRGDPRRAQGRRRLRADRSRRARRARRLSPGGQRRRGAGDAERRPGGHPAAAAGSIAPGASPGRSGDGSSAGPGKRRLRHLHLGLDRPAQGRSGHPRQRQPADGPHRRVVWLRPGRRLDPVPLLRLRLLGLGDLGRAALRRPPGRRALPDQPLARGLRRAAAARAGDGAQPDALGLPAAPG